MRKYMWPNSCLPSATALITAANTGSEARFTLEGVENHAARECILFVPRGVSHRETLSMFRLPTDAARMGTSP